MTLLGVILCISSTGCVQYIFRYDGPYEGKIVDAETGAPIEGVVILGVWYKETPTVAGAVSSFYDAVETVTDKNGNFRIKGKGLKILSDVGVMNFLIFKAGYKYIGLWTWAMFRESEDFSKKIKWENGRPIVPLRKLTMEERKKQLVGKHNIVPDEKQRLLIQEINKEQRDTGRPTY